jgi:hypothetical protein
MCDGTNLGVSWPVPLPAVPNVSEKIRVPQRKCGTSDGQSYKGGTRWGTKNDICGRQRRPPKGKWLERRRRTPCYFIHILLFLITPGQNIFWKINCDPYTALSFDRLHTFPGGMFKHLWAHAKDKIEALDRSEHANIDAMCVLFPYNNSCRQITHDM